MLKERLIIALESAIKSAFPKNVSALIEYPSNPDHGDYSCPIALQLSKIVKKPPREVGETIVKHLPTLDFVDRVEIAGPGFINFHIKPEYLVQNLNTILDQADRYGTNTLGKGIKIMVEYSSPNTNKPLHLGHARNDFLGMAVANLLQANGYEVVKTQNANNRGVHICKSMLAYELFGHNETPESTGKKGDHFVGDYYVRYAKELEKDPSLEEKVNVMLKQWEEKDPHVRELWKKMEKWVWKGINETYDRIGAKFDFSTFESDMSEGGRKLVEKALEQGRAKRIEGGAIVINLKDCGLGDSETGYKVLIKSNGTTIYMTQDIQLAVGRMQNDPSLDRIIYVVGNEQDYHFKVLFEVLKRFGYEWATQCYHLSYGMIDLPSGKMKSREGTTVDIDNLLDELEALVEKELDEREMPYKGKERKHLAQAIALGALKYFILKVDSRMTMLYDPVASIDFQGNTGPYLQYTYARLKSILRKQTRSEAECAPPTHEAKRSALFSSSPPAFSPREVMKNLGEPEVLAILRKLQLYPEIVVSAGNSYHIHLVANYLNELAQLLNGFYVQFPVLEGVTPEVRAARLHLVTACAQVLKNGLALMGIEAVERM